MNLHNTELFSFPKIFTEKITLKCSFLNAFWNRRQANNCLPKSSLNNQSTNYQIIWKMNLQFKMKLVTFRAFQLHYTYILKNLHILKKNAVIFWPIRYYKFQIAGQKSLCLRHCLATRTERSVGRDYRASSSREHANTQAERSALRGTPDDTWEWPFAQSYDSWSRHSLRFASQSCPLFLGSLWPRCWIDTPRFVPAGRDSNRETLCHSTEISRQRVERIVWKQRLC